jgi:16S rRNA (cytosine967-C5)-methyltransferase
VSPKSDLPRQLVFSVLCRFEKSSTERLKADRLIQDALNHTQTELSAQDRAFVYALVMGTLRHWYRLEEWIKRLTGRNLKQMTPSVRVLLKLGLFQLYGLSHIPAYAAINTTVELAKQQKNSVKTVKFINAILREAQRGLESTDLQTNFEGQPIEKGNLLQALLWSYGWPETLTQMLLANYNAESIIDMAQNAQQPEGLSIRVNTLKIDSSAYKECLQQAGYEYIQNELFSEGLILTHFSGTPRHLPGYADGWFYVQDLSSMWVSHLLNPQPGEQVLDLCAAPGSKTTHMAALMKNQGNITAIEPKKERLALLNENLERLGITNVLSVEADGLDWSPPTGLLYDKVLVDAPCSGLGTLRRHPEILLHWRKMDLSAYQNQQYALLQKGFDCLKPGGALVYSTCSILRTENQDVLAKLLSQHLDAILESEEQRLIQKNADGFYAARILKKV